MFGKGAGAILAATMLVALTAESTEAATVRVKVEGKQWDVTALLADSGNLGDLSSVFEGQAWWNDEELAGRFAVAVGDLLGTPNFKSYGPLFIHGSDAALNEFFARAMNLPGRGSPTLSELTVEGSESVVYATAAPIPLPAGGLLLLSGLGLAAVLTARRRAA